MQYLHGEVLRVVIGELGADAALVGAAEAALDEVASPAGLAAWAARS